MHSQSDTQAGSGSFQSIGEFYAGKDVFITGITGFIGKVLLEKLLWACPQVGRVYAMMRPKRGRPVEERLEELLDSALFDRLRRDRPDFRDQIRPVQGDMFEPGLGLAPEAIEELQERRGHRPLRRASEIAVQMNLDGPRKVAELCEGIAQAGSLGPRVHRLRQLRAQVVDEIVYAPDVHPQKLLDAIRVTPKLLGQKPNTYTFTKQLAEFYLDPFPGWVDNFNGPTGLFAAVGKGMMRIMHGGPQLPGGHCATCGTSGSFKPQGRQPVCTMRDRAGQPRLTWADIETLTPKNFVAHPTQSAIRLPKAVFTTNTLWYQVPKAWLFIPTSCPPSFVDLWVDVRQREKQFVALSNRINKSIQLWIFHHRIGMFNNCSMCITHGVAWSPSDRVPNSTCDASKLDWHEYLERYCIGVKRYALKESDEDVGTAGLALENFSGARPRPNLRFASILTVQSTK
uniref:Fatty acyl-CoA reductase n=1 Tax=Macrostomum lignano TaxID=282301 RepID=A0A1I8FAQ0_9PLAT